MEHSIILTKAKQQLKGKYISYVATLWCVTIVMSLLNIGIPVKMMMEHPMWYFPYLFAMIALIVARNTVYVLFIKAVRKEVFQKKDLHDSITKTGTHILTALLFEVIQMGLVMLIQMVGSFVPFLMIPILILMQVMLASVSVFIAFAIYDGVRGSWQIVSGSFRLMKQNWKEFFVASLPFMIWLLLYQLGDNLLTSMMSDNYQLTMFEILQAALASEALALYAYGWMALSLANTIISCLLLVPLYTAFANVYEDQYLKFYPFHPLIRSNVIDIDEQS